MTWRVSFSLIIQEFLSRIVDAFQGFVRCSFALNINEDQDTKVVCHLQKFPENPVEKQMEHSFSYRSSVKFPGAREHLKR